MTTIVAMHNGNGGYIASDGRITGKNIVQEDNKKLLKYEDYIIGMSGLSALSQLVEFYHVPMGLASEPDVYALYQHIITLLDRYGYKTKLKDFHMIILTRFGVYLYDGIENTFVRKNTVASIGSGANLAYGYLHAYEDMIDISDGDTSAEVLMQTLDECIQFVSHIDPYTNNQIISYSL